MRKRVLLKSPVRENRTPGSVRGAPGNRRVYRDDGVLLLMEAPCDGPRTASDEIGKNQDM
jgi:hypothetical protein